MMAQPKGTILLTGANGSLGSAIVSEIASRPEFAAYHGIYAVRNASAAPALKSALQAGSRPHSYDILSLDLADLESVRETATAINARIAAGGIPHIRAIILNAAYQEFDTQTWTADGFDASFASNYLGHWLLTLLLLQSLDREYGRVVVIGSLAHDPDARQNNSAGQFSDEKWKEIFRDGTEPIARGTWSTVKEDPSWCSGFRRYGASKLCQLMMLGELQRRLDLDPILSSVSVLGTDPGTMPSNLVRRGPWMIRVFLFQLVLPLVAVLATWVMPNGPLRTTKKSAQTVLKAAFDLNPQTKGLYLDGSEPTEMSREAKDPEKRKTLWSDTVRYASLREGETCLAQWK